MKQSFKVCAALVASVFATGAAQAAGVFEGRAANGAVDLSCKPEGSLGARGNACFMYYDSRLNITILNDWVIGAGTWDKLAGPGSAQKAAADAGFAVSKLTGWVLPTLDQYQWIWKDSGSSLNGLRGQFYQVQSTGAYWASDDFSGRGGLFRSTDGIMGNGPASFSNWALAVRPGDVAAAVPEPETYAMLLAGLIVVGGIARRRKQAQ